MNISNKNLKFLLVIEKLKIDRLPKIENKKKHKKNSIIINLWHKTCFNKKTLKLEFSLGKAYQLKY